MSEAPADPRAALVTAVKAGDAARARALLAAHPELRARINDPAEELPFGGRPLRPVVESGNREMIDVFLEAGADINGRSDWWAGSFGVLDSCEPELAPFRAATPFCSPSPTTTGHPRATAIHLVPTQALPSTTTRMRLTGCH